MCFSGLLHDISVVLWEHELRSNADSLNQKFKGHEVAKLCSLCCSWSVCFLSWGYFDKHHPQRRRQMVTTRHTSPCQGRPVDHLVWTWLLLITQIMSGLQQTFSWTWKLFQGPLPCYSVPLCRASATRLGFIDTSASILSCQWSSGMCAKTPFPFWLASATGNH